MMKPTAILLKLLLLVLTLAVVSPSVQALASAADTDLQAFKGDGCSGFPDGTPSNPTRWQHCCDTHDVAYWHGGTQPERRKADQVFEACVAAAANPFLAFIMHTGVRIFGSPHLPTDFRWGFGWPKGRGYKALTEAEKRQVELRQAEQSRPKIQP